jgi:hypothetical protein
MKWTIRIELTPDGNPPITYDIGTITRAIADLSPEEIGLTLEEGQQMLRRIQVVDIIDSRPILQQFMSNAAPCRDALPWIHQVTNEI